MLSVYFCFCMVRVLRKVCTTAMSIKLDTQIGRILKQKNISITMNTYSVKPLPPQSLVMHWCQLSITINYICNSYLNACEFQHYFDVRTYQPNELFIRRNCVSQTFKYHLTKYDRNLRNFYFIVLLSNYLIPLQRQS